MRLRVPNRAQMAYGIGQSIQSGIEYEIKGVNVIELTCSDIMKLARMKVAFQGELMSISLSINVRVELPKYEA